MDPELYRRAQSKCQTQLGIGLSPLIKVFLKSFISKRGVGFYIGDPDISRQFNNWLSKKSLEMHRKGCAPLPGPKLKDLYRFK
jgi:hypothetical protein